MTDINKNEMSVPNLNGKLFSYRIKYNQKDGTTNPDTGLFAGKNVKPMYNGNIAEVDWRTVESLGANPLLDPKRYSYAYDALNRLTAGYYQNPNNPWSKEHTEVMDYDVNGNISNMYRTSVVENSTTATVIDRLTYGYAGNKVININDLSTNPSGYEGGGNTITYDPNGNMENLLDKRITSIKYNFLNLPERIEISSLQGGIGFKYTADGTKLQKTNSIMECGITNCYTVNTISDYLDGFQYLSSTTTGGGSGSIESLAASRELSKAMEMEAYTIDHIITPIEPGIDPPIGGGGLTIELKDENLVFFPTAEGNYDYKKDQYIYQYKDLHENVRISFGRNSAGALEITDANDYYPFGMNNLKTGNAIYGKRGSGYRNYKFLGKELQETGFYDLGARFYMPELGIFAQHDPLSAATLDPYGYAYNNPMFFSDPTGLYGAQINKKGEIPATSPGGADNPLDVGEVVITPPMKSVVSKTRSTIPSNCLVCNIGGGIIAPRIISSVPEIRRSYYNFNPYRSDNTPEWYGFGGRANWGLGTAAASLDNFSGSTRITTTGSSIKIYRRNSKGNVFIRNKYVKTIGISKIGASIGTASFFLGVAFDGIGVINYINNPNSPNTVHPGKATLNTVMGYVGWRGGAYGAAISTLYFGVDNFYPGGWIGASETAAMTEANEQQMTGHPFFSNSAIKY